MTPSDAVALLEAHRSQWPEWMAGAIPTGGVLWARSIAGDMIRIRLYTEPSWPRQKGRLARVQDGLPDEENVRRILQAAEKGYHQRLRQVEKKGLERRARLKPVNRKRKAKRFEEDFGGKDRVEWGASRPCDTCGAPPPSQNSHILSRNGRLGKAREVISQCQECHDQVYEVDTQELLEIAAKVYREWLDQGGHELPSGLERHGETR